MEKFTPGGCYGIEWEFSNEKLSKKAHYNPQWRVEEAQAMGWNVLYTEKSGEFEFAVGEGLVGKAFQSQEVVFVKDLQEFDSEALQDTLFMGDMGAFLRKELAKDFGLHSAIFLPSCTGVFEIGSSCFVTALPEFFAPYSGVNTPRLASADAEAGTGADDGGELRRQVSDPSLMLSSIVGTQMQCAYGIEWVLEGERLVFKSQYNPSWRIEGVKKQCLQGYYTAESATFTFAPGEGLVGRAFADQALIFAQDLQTHSGDAAADYQDGWRPYFLRAEIARNYGIHSAVFLPTADGVVEVGSTQEACCLQDLFSEPARAAIAGKTEASDLLSALLSVEH